MLEGFTESINVEGRSSIADVFRPGKRCGLYILYFANGETYAGKSVDVTRRYVQHCKVWSDIVEMRFRRLEEEKLDEEEARLIWALEKANPNQRNITFTSIPKGESDFDLIMPLDEQEKWLQGINLPYEDDRRIVNTVLRGKYQAKYERFAKLPDSDKLVEVLRAYVQIGIPVPLRSEVSFWSCSCLPGYSSKNVNIYSRINVNWQEVFTLSEFQRHTYASFHLAKSPLEEASKYWLWRLKKAHKSVIASNQLYQPGGQDQIQLEVRGADAALELLKEESVVRAIRLLNMRLMKKGPCAYNKNHCLALADRLI